MTARTHIFGTLTLLLAAALFAGCQQRPATLAPVSGKVTYRGAALPGGLVVFTPDAARGESGTIACAEIRADGTYVLNTGESPGATAGWYRVTVAALAPAGAGLPVPLVPEKYGDPQTSLLSCEVKANRTNQLDFNLD